MRGKIAIIGGEVSPIETSSSISQIAAKILAAIIIPIAAAIAVAAVIYGGVLYITSQGDPEKLTKAKKTLLYAIIGIFLVALSWAIVITLSGGFLNKVL